MYIKIKVTHVIISIVLLVGLFGGAVALAGGPDSPGAPTDAASDSYSLEDLYNRLNAGTAGSQSAFTEPSSAPGSGTMHTLNDIMAQAPALDNTNGATTTHVLAGQTFWGLTASQWATQTGTMVNNGAGSIITPTTTNRSVASGYWSSANTVQGDTNLDQWNIRSGVTIFGVTGNCHLLPATGQTTEYSSGDDGTYQYGCRPVVVPQIGYDGGNFNRTDLPWSSSWGITGFVDMGDGTVRDTLTGLIWLKNANCAGGKRQWNTALNDVASLNSGGTMNGNDCSDASNSGSHQTDWRLPNLNELISLIDPDVTYPVLPGGHPFDNVQSSSYWSGSTYSSMTSYAWLVFMSNSYVTSADKVNITAYVWPVRGGQ